MRAQVFAAQASRVGHGWEARPGRRERGAAGSAAQRRHTTDGDSVRGGLARHVFRVVGGRGGGPREGVRAARGSLGRAGEVLRIGRRAMGVTAGG